MRGAPLLLALVLTMPILAVADASTPLPPPGRVWTVYNTVDAVVEDNYAVVRIIADIANRGPDPEFPFAVRIPADAFVTGLSITRDGQTFEAQVQPREEARQQYEDWKAQQQTGGLVERQRGTQVYAYLINVAEFTNVRAELTYERYLAADQGLYNLALEAPVSGFGQDVGARFGVTLRHADDVTGVLGSPDGEVRRDGPSWSVTHSVGARGREDAPTPFNVSYQLKPTPGSGALVARTQGGQGYFAHHFRPPADARTLPLDLVLVLDTSGSMGGLKLRQLQDAASQVIGMLHPEDRLHLAMFSSEATSRWVGLRNATPDARREAIADVQAAFAAGGTNIEGAIREGFGAFEGIDWRVEEGRLPLLVFLTDGQPSAGLTGRDELRRAARDANAHGAHVFALAFGADADWSLVAGLAADGAGTALRVPEGDGAEVDLQRFMAALTTPVLKDVTITYRDGVQAERRSAPILFAGSELLVIGTFNASLARIEGTVRGTAPDGPRVYNFSEPVATAAKGSFLPRLVASEQIRHTQDLIAAEGERPAWVDAIRTLALAHGFVTDYTSLVVTLDPRAPDPCGGRCIAVDADGDSGSPAPMSSTAGSASNARTSAPAPWTPSFDSTVSEEMAKRTPAQTPGFEVVAGLAALAAVGLALRRKR